MKKLGSGSYGNVYRIKTKNGKQHALKTFEGETLVVGINDIKEVDISLRLRHPYVIQILDYTTDYVINDKTSKYAILYPLADGTFDSLGEQIPQEDRCEKFIKYFLQLILALKYIHDRGIILVDIKPKNILYFSKEDAVKFTDFGLSVYDDKIFRTGMHGTPMYAAPEVIFEHENREIYKASDIWSLGMTFLETLIGYSPQKNAIRSSNSKNIKNYKEKFNYYISQLDAELKIAFQKIKNNDIVRMLVKMLDVDYEKRITASELVNLPIFYKYRDNFTIIEKLYSGCPILLLYINAHNLLKHKKISNILTYIFNHCKYEGDYWGWFNAVDIINYLLTINFIHDDEEYITFAAFILSIKLYSRDYYELSNITTFIPTDFNIDYKVLEFNETKIFDKLNGKIYRKNIFSYLIDLKIKFNKKNLSKYVLSNNYEGEIPDYAYNFLIQEEINTNNPYLKALIF